MEKTAIKNFAIEARKILMRSAEVQAGLYGVTKDGCSNPIQKGAGFEVYQTVAGTENRIYGEDISKRRDLVDAVNEIGFAQVMEKAAYTWFNRLIAIRFMEVNDYLPTRTRVLSSATGSKTPDIVTEYREVNLNLTDEDLEKVQMCIKENKYDDAFEYLFVKQCKELKRVLPKLFKKTDDYMELLLKLSYINDGVVRMLVDTIPECNFNVQDEGQVEIIGWMYQYYNTEPKSAAFGKKGKITKEEIPAVTQLFTPDWIVRYMVENSLGRLWIEGHPDTWELLKDNWKDKRNKKYGAELSETARILAREIERTYLKVYNKNNKVRLMIENAAPELLPRELDPDVPDNQILSVALKYKNWEVFIISDDGVFRLAAMAQRIVAMNSEDFINQHKEHYKSLEERIKECNSETNTEITSKDIASDTVSEEASERLADKIAKAVGNIILEPSMQSEEEDGSQELAIDDLPIRELKKYIPDFNEPVFSYLQSNQVKTVGAFRHLTESKVRNMPAKGKQMVYKNTVMRAVKQLDSIIAKIKLK